LYSCYVISSLSLLFRITITHDYEITTKNLNELQTNYDTVENKLLITIENNKKLQKYQSTNENRINQLGK
jgi:hypothetical protein